MFLELNKKPKSNFAAVDYNGRRITYGELCCFSSEFYSFVNKRTLIFILSENSIGSLAGYVACMSNRVIPLLLSSNINKELLNNLISIYQPEYLWVSEKLSANFDFNKIYFKYDYILFKTGLRTFDLYDNLSLLLTTSGSTGSPKLVRHSYSNIESNARNVSCFFELTSKERAVAILPMQYTMGLSVVTSHLYSGATVLLVDGNLTDKGFWKFIKCQRATSFTGVPFSFEVLFKLDFFNMDLPDLKLLSQGGGKLNKELFKAFAEFSQRSGRRFVATYGQTEATARMAYLPPEMATRKIGSIGKAIPNGQLYLVNERGEELKEMDALGEMVFKGSNVTLGYATKGEDLCKGDENNGVLYTGDIARRDAEGYFYYVGRISRFLKLYGLRISLDEMEQMIKSGFGIDCFCTGNDEKMQIFIIDREKTNLVKNYITEKTGLFHQAIEVILLDQLPRNDSGKIIIS